MFRKRLMRVNLMFAFVLALSLLPTAPAVRTTSAATVASSNPFYDFDIIADAANNSLGITGMGRNPSINDNGTVAFVGKTSTGEGIFVGDSASTLRNVVPSGFMGSTRPYGDPTQINNNRIVVGRQRVGTFSPTTSPTYRLHRIDANRDPSTLTLIASGGPNFSPYDVILGPPTINNDGGMAFAVEENGLRYLVTPKDPTAEGTDRTLHFNEVQLSGVLHPMIADDDPRGGTAGTNGHIVVKAGAGVNSPIRLFDYELRNPTDIACAPGAACAHPGFTELGNSPGISDDGKMIVFAGNKGNGRGVFASIDDSSGTRTLVTIAGENSSPRAELGFAVGNPLLPDGSPLYLKDFDLNARTGVIHNDFGTKGVVDKDDGIIVSFIATPNEASRTNPTTGNPLLFSGQKGLWTVQVDIEDQLAAPFNRVYHPRSPLKVVQLNDQLDGKQISDLAVYDPVALAATDSSGNPRVQRRPDHRIAFWATTAAGRNMIVRGGHLDSDEDGLFDHWETNGIDMNGDGATDLDLRAMGANPFKRDIFLEMDWLNDRNDGINPAHSNQPAPGVTAALMDMFDKQGITLHIDAGPSNDASGNPFSQKMGTGPLQGGQTIGQPSDPSKHIDVVYFGMPGSMTVPGVETRDFHGIKEEFFLTNDKGSRELVFHYAVLADFRSFILGGSGTPVVVPITAANATTLTTSGNAFTDSSGNLFDLSGKVVKIITGTGQGQIRRIVSNTVSQLTIKPSWSTVPNTTSSFTLIDGSSGLGEVYDYPSPDNHSIPGNDFIMSLGNFGVNQYGSLGNPYLQWRTLAHELGHNLALRHCGTDKDETLCDGDPDAANNITNLGEFISYLSLMSYSHQAMRKSGYNSLGMAPIDSYSTAGDPTFEDWANLKLDFQSAAIHLGNTFGKGLGGTSEPEEQELTVADYERINNAPVDLAGPTLTVNSPAQGAVVAPGSNLKVDLSATDDDNVDSVNVSFDVDGDGTENGPAETITASNTGPGTYEATFSSVSGLDGIRTIRISAEDPSGNIETVTRDITVSNAPPPNLPPIANAGGPYTVDEGASVTVEGTGSDPEGGPLTYGWDLDNNGTFETPGQSLSFSATGLDGPSSRTIAVQVTDSGGLSATGQATVDVKNVAPSATFDASSSVDEGSPVSLALTNPSDPSSADTAAGFTYAFDCGSGYAAASTGSTASCATSDNEVRTVKGKIIDKDGGATEYTSNVTINNVAPAISTISGPTAPVAVNNAVTISAPFTDPGTADTHTATVDWGDGTSSAGTVSAGAASASHTYMAAGVYTLKLTVTDDDRGSGSSLYQYVVVYDPEAGFVTGGGWINSSAGAYAADPALSGRANFGFVSRYKKGATTPTGETEFQFKAGNLNFHSASYEWLVVSGAKAQYKGVGTINGSGDYGFLLTATDGQVTGGGGADKFRIKIWDHATGSVVYDNQMGAADGADPSTVLGGGSIVIHAK